MQPGRMFYVNCPECSYRYYVSTELLAVKGKPTICPKCHHEFSLENVPVPAECASGWKNNFEL